MIAAAAISVPPGYCECGCGRKTSLARQTDRTKGWVRGEPLRFVRGHAMKVRTREPITEDDYVVQDHGFETPCWIWRGSRTALGYAKVVLGGRSVPAHRAMYEQEIGPIPPGLELDHLCVVPSCVRPSHLDPVTHAENIRRAYERNPWNVKRSG